MSSDSEVKTYLGNAFKRLDKRIDELFEMKDEKTTVLLFFSKHKYTAKDLFESRVYQSIQSMIEKIADDISNWKEAGALDISTRNIYNVNRDLVEDRIIDLEQEVQNREPTLWEKVADFFTKFIGFIAKKLPKLWSGLMLFADKLKDVPAIGTVASLLLTFDKSVRSLLVSKKHKYIQKTEKSDFVS